MFDPSARAGDVIASPPMDTIWLAIDADGHVAVFESGEAGAVPTAAHLGEDYQDLLDAVLAVGGDDPGPTFDGDDDAAFDDDLDGHRERARRCLAAGVYLYAHLMTENAVAGPYERTVCPSPPRVAEAPPDVVARMAVFPGRFADHDELQPVEHWPVASWSAAWLATDGKTLRCLPGRAAQYAQQVDDLRADFEPGELVIEPPPP